MEVVKGVHPRWPADGEITVKPYYPTKVTRRHYDPAGYNTEARSGWVSEESFEDAEIQRWGTSGITKAEQMILYIPRDHDPETGGFWDVDGTRSRRSILMHVVDVQPSGTLLVVTGFVLDDDDGWGNSHTFHAEEWRQVLRSEGD